MSLTGVKHHTVQGTKVLLQCQVSRRDLYHLSSSSDYAEDVVPLVTCVGGIARESVNLPPPKWKGNELNRVSRISFRPCRVLGFMFARLQVNGARPAANVTWYNTTRQLIPEQEQSTISTQTVRNSVFGQCS